MAALLAGARSGQSGVLVIRGEAGIGKTALLSHMAAAASDFRVLHVCGSELEMEFPYAGVQQLCGPLLAFVAQLPEPQQRALEVSLGLKDGDPPDRLLVSLAVLTLLGAANNDRPTLCVVDDAQWIDTSSLQTLSFVARRLLAEPIVMVFAARRAGAEQELRGHPKTVLAGLNGEESQSLLMSVLPGPLDEYVKDNLLAEAPSPDAAAVTPRGRRPRRKAGMASGGCQAPRHLGRRRRRRRSRRSHHGRRRDSVPPSAHSLRHLPERLFHGSASRPHCPRRGDHRAVR